MQKDTVKAIFNKIHNKPYKSTKDIERMQMSNQVKTLKTYLRLRGINIKDVSLAKLNQLVEQRHRDIVRALNDVFYTHKKLYQIARNCYLSKGMLNKLVNSDSVLAKYMKEKGIHHTLKYLRAKAARQKNVTYNQKLECYFGDSTKFQDKQLCKYYENVLVALENVDFVDKNGNHRDWPMDNTSAAPLDIVQSYMYDNIDEGADYSGIPNTETISRMDIFQGDNAVSRPYGTKYWPQVKRNITKALDWMSDNLVLSHDMTNGQRIIFYRNPHYPTLHSIAVENRRIDRAYRKKYGQSKYEQQLLRMKEAHLVTPYSAIIAFFEW